MTLVVNRGHAFPIRLWAFLIVCNPQTSFGLWLEKEYALVVKDKSLTKSVTTSLKVRVVEEGGF